MDKPEIRTIIRDKREKLSKEYIDYSNNIIKEKFLNMKEYKKSRNIFCYISKKNEVDTIDIINNALDNGKKVIVPKCIDNNIEIYYINSLDDVTIGEYNILEPKEYCVKANKEEIDLAIIPCMTCDKDGNRIGYGKGYFDRFLMNANFYTVVLCRSKLMMDKIEIQPHDIQINKVICDE